MDPRYFAEESNVKINILEGVSSSSTCGGDDSADGAEKHCVPLLEMVDIEHDINFPKDSAMEAFGSAPYLLMDCQGFTGMNNEFIIREMAVLEHIFRHCVTVRHYVFRAPYSDSLLSTSAREENELASSCHGLRWSDHEPFSSEHYPQSQLRPIVRNILTKWLEVTSLVKQYKVHRIFVYGYNILNLLYKLMEPADDEERNLADTFDVIDLSQPFIYRELIELDKLLIATPSYNYCMEHYLIDAMEDIRMKLATNHEGEGGRGLKKNYHCSLKIVTLVHQYIYQNSLLMDAKSELTAWSTKHRLDLSFQTQQTSPFIFHSEVVVGSFEFVGIGEGSSKKLAEKNACENFLNSLKAPEDYLGSSLVANFDAVSSECSGNLIKQSKQISITEMQEAVRRKKRNQNIVFMDAKSFLCHWCRINCVRITEDYAFGGEPHRRTFTCSMKLQSPSLGEIIIQAVANSKKDANRLTAKKTVKHLMKENLVSPSEVKCINLDSPEDEHQRTSTHELNSADTAGGNWTDFNANSFKKVEDSVGCLQDPAQSNILSPNSSDNKHPLDTSFRPSRLYERACGYRTGFQNESSSKEVCGMMKEVQSNFIRPSTLQEMSSRPSRIQNVSSSKENDEMIKEMDSLNLGLDQNGKWDISTAKSKLHQFFQENNINADYTYTTDCYNLEGYHVAFMQFYLQRVGRTFRATGNARTKEEASKICAFSLVKQLYRANLIGAYNGSLKKEKPLPEYETPIEVFVPDDCVGNIRKLCVEFGEDVPKLMNLSDIESRSIVLSSPPLNSEDISSIDDIIQIKFGSTKTNWNPWISRPIQENECDYNVSLRDLSWNMKSTFEKKSSTEVFKEMLWKRQNLPIFRFKEDILHCIEDHPVTVITGTTGCGKSTQVCQYIVDEAIESGYGSHVNVIVIEPRRICALSLAERVAAERTEQLGRSVGYNVRFECRLPRTHGAILFCTPGTFIRKLESGIIGISHIIVDEVHERTVEIDYILIILRNILKNHPMLKVVLISASIDIDLFTSYFDGCPNISVSGNSHPVKDYFLEDSVELINFKLKYSQCESHVEISDTFENTLEDSNIPENLLYCTDTLKTVAEVQKHPICFELIEAIILWLREKRIEGSILVFLPGWSEIRIATLHLQASKFSNYLSILPLHSKLGNAEQRQVFMPGPRGKTKARYERLPDIIEPEMCRTPLYKVALSIKFLKLGNTRTVLNNAIQPPDLSAVEEAERLLIDLNCLDNQNELTPLGNILARLPLDPRLGRMVLLSTLFNCTDQVLKLAAHASTQEEFFMEFPTGDMSCIGKERFSDHIAALYALSTKNEIDHYQFSLKKSSIIETIRTEEQLCSILENIGFDIASSYNSSNKNLDIVTALLCQGFYPNVCFYNEKRKVYFSDGNFGLISKKSIMCYKDECFNLPSPILIYGERNETCVNVCRNLTMVTPMHLLCFTNCKVSIEQGLIKIDDWLTLQMDPNTAALIMSVRSIINSALLEAVADPTSLYRGKNMRLANVVRSLCKIDFGKGATGGAPMFPTRYEVLHSPSQRGPRRRNRYEVNKNPSNGCLWLKD